MGEEVPGTQGDKRQIADEELAELQPLRMWYSLLMNDMGPVPPEAAWSESSRDENE